VRTILQGLFPAQMAALNKQNEGEPAAPPAARKSRFSVEPTNVGARGSILARQADRATALVCAEPEFIASQLFSVCLRSRLGPSCSVASFLPFSRKRCPCPVRSFSHICAVQSPALSGSQSRGAC
jgi:hypothetical protein